MVWACTNGLLKLVPKDKTISSFLAMKYDISPFRVLVLWAKKNLCGNVSCNFVQF